MNNGHGFSSRMRYAKEGAGKRCVLLMVGDRPGIPATVVAASDGSGATGAPEEKGLNHCGCVVAGGAHRGHRLLPSRSCRRPGRPGREVRAAGFRQLLRGAQSGCRGAQAGGASSAQISGCGRRAGALTGDSRITGSPGRPWTLLAAGRLLIRSAIRPVRSAACIPSRRAYPARAVAGCNGRSSRTGRSCRLGACTGWRMARSRVRVALGAQHSPRRSDHVLSHTLMIFTRGCGQHVPV